MNVYGGFTLHGELSQNEDANLSRKMVLMYGVLVGRFFGFKSFEPIDRLMYIFLVSWANYIKKQRPLKWIEFLDILAW